MIECSFGGPRGVGDSEVHDWVWPGEVAPSVLCAHEISQT